MSVTSGKPEHVATAFANAWNRHDMDEFASLFASDANFVNVVGVWWKNRSRSKRRTEPPMIPRFGIAD